MGVAGRSLLPPPPPNLASVWRRNVPSIFKRIEGRHGAVTSPAIGLEIGTMEYWSLTRREDTPSGVEAWDLRADLSYINRFAWERPGMTRSITIWLGNPRRGGQQFRLELTDGRTDLDGRSLLIEKVKLCPLESPV
jgi:hypothetical protein